MGLLNQPRLARTAKQGLMSPLEIQMDTMINDPLRPNLSSRLTQQDMVNKGLLAIGMAPMGTVNPFKKLADEAWQNALGGAEKFTTKKWYPAPITMNGKTINFAAHKNSGGGPLHLTLLGKEQGVDAFKTYKITKDGELELQGVNVVFPGSSALDEFNSLFNIK